MVTSFFTPCSPILSANSPKNDPAEPGEHLYNVPASSGGRAAAVWGEKDERKASLARPQPQQSPREVETPGPIRGAAISCQAAAE